MIINSSACLPGAIIWQNMVNIFKRIRILVPLGCHNQTLHMDLTCDKISAYDSVAISHTGDLCGWYQLDSSHIWELYQEPIPIEKSHNSQLGTPFRSRMVSGAWWLPSWELYDFSIGMGSCFYPMIHGNVGHSMLGNCTVPNGPFSTDFDTGRRIIHNEHLQEYCNARL